VAKYLGNYLEGGMTVRRDDWKGARRIEYDRKESVLWKDTGSQFAWYSEGSRAWRARLTELAQAANLGYDDLDGFRRLWGQKWCFRWRPWIMMATEVEWRESLMCVAECCGGELPPRPMTIVGSEVLVWYTSLAEWQETGQLSESRIYGECPF